jgi:hypothetical protein
LRRVTVNALGDVSCSTRLRGWLAAVWRFVRTAPLTYLRLAVLLGTTIRQLQAGRHLHRLLVHASTNIHDLATDPLHVLFESLLWIDGRSWTSYLVLFTLFLAPAEHWLGQMRWLTVGLTAHVGATLHQRGLAVPGDSVSPRAGATGPRHRYRGQLLSGRRGSGAGISHCPAMAMGLSRGIDHDLRHPADHAVQLHCDRPLFGDLHRAAVLPADPTAAGDFRVALT